MVLRNFNKNQLNLEVLNGSDMNKIIGIGYRKNPKTDRLEKITDHYPSQLREVMMMFEYYPIFDYFGLTLTDALNLPMDQWQGVRKAAERMGPRPPKQEGPSEESQMLLQIIQQLITGKGEGG